jgi:LEA14-like dessication related protein
MKKFSFFLLFVLSFAISTSAQPQPLSYVGVENFKIQQVDKQMASISLDIKLYNPNDFKIKLKDADIDVFIDGNQLGNVQSAEKYEVPKNDTCLVPVILNVALKKILPNALQLVLSNGIADVKLTGTVKAGRYGIYKKIPLDYESKQDIGALLNIK